MEITNSKPLIGKKDRIINYKSKWPFYILNSLDPKGIWLRLKTQLDVLEYQKILQDIRVEEIEEFFSNNPDIAFETDFCEETLHNYFFFKIKNQIYCYTSGKKGKDKTRIYARFYFNLEDIIKN